MITDEENGLFVPKKTNLEGGNAETEGGSVTKDAIKGKDLALNIKKECDMEERVDADAGDEEGADKKEIKDDNDRDNHDSGSKRVELNEDCCKVVCSFLSPTDRWDLLKQAVEYSAHNTIKWLLNYDPSCGGPVRFEGLGMRYYNAVCYVVSTGQDHILDFIVRDTEVRSQSGEGVVEWNGFGCTLLHVAVSHHQTEMVKKLLTYPNIDINAKNYITGASALAMAIRFDYIDIVAILINDERIDINLLDFHDHTPCLLALALDRVECAKLILAHPKVDINYEVPTPSQGYNRKVVLKGALSLCIERCHDDLFNMILNRQDLDRKIYSRSIRTAKYTRRLRVLEVLLALCCRSGDNDVGLKSGYNFDIFVDGPDLYTILGILYSSTKIPKEQCMSLARSILKRQFIDNEEGVNSKDLFGESPLVWAAGNGYLEFMMMMMEYDEVDMNQTNEWGSTALIMSIANYHPRRSLQVVQALLERQDVDVNIVNRYGFTALHWAIRNECLEIVEMLLALRPDVKLNIMTSRGNTALHMAASRNNAAMMHCLLQHLHSCNDGDVNMVNGNGETVLMVAAKYNQTNIFRMILEDPSLDPTTVAVDCSGDGDNAYDGRESALQYASLNHNHEMVAMLLEYMISHRRDGVYMDEVLIYASLHGLVDIVKLLLDGKDLEGNDLDIDIDINKRRLFVPLGQEIPETHYSQLSIFARAANGDTALMCACNRKNKKGYAIGSALTSSKAKNADGDSNLSISDEKVEAVVTLLLSHPDIDLNVINNHNSCALMMALNTSNTTAMALLLQHPTHKGRQALDLTGGISFNHDAPVPYSHLLYSKYDNIVHTAAKGGNVQFFQLCYDYHLTQLSEIINAKNASKWTALRCACEKSDTDVSKEIINILLAVPGISIMEYDLWNITAEVRHMLFAANSAANGVEGSV